MSESKVDASDVVILRSFSSAFNDPLNVLDTITVDFHIHTERMLLGPKDAGHPFDTVFGQTRIVGNGALRKRHLAQR